MGDCVESLAEVKVDNIHGSPFVYLASHVIVESYQIGQAWFPFGESMLTTPDNLLFFHPLLYEQCLPAFLNLSPFVIYHIFRM